VAEQQQPEQSDPAERILRAIDELPPRIGEQVGYKLRQERLLMEDHERNLRDGQQNRAYGQRKQWEFRQAAYERRTRQLSIVAIAVSGLGVAAAATSVVVQLVS
jgi:hypothetical protein